ncbi:hypothetical protein Ocin01_07680, partial [Orchesella cincta]
GVAIGEEFDLRKALQKCYAGIPTDKYGAWVEKEYQRFKENCYNDHPDTLCRKLCFFTATPHHPVFNIITSNKNGEWRLSEMPSFITFDTLGIDVISETKFVPVATPDNPKPKPSTIITSMDAITDKLNKKLKQCAPKVFRAADRKADTCEELGEDDKRKLTDLVECIETALTC